MTLKALLDFGVDFFESGGINDAEFDAKELLCHLLSLNNTDLLLQYDKFIPDDIEQRYIKLLKRRAASEPLQYIIGNWDFCGNSFAVGEGVLIPRPETEELVDFTISFIKKNNIKTVVDLCAGSGCIGITIAKACPDVYVYLVEKYPQAAFYCKKNIDFYKLKNAELVMADIFNGKPTDMKDADLIISNPPYIPADELEHLQKEVTFEPISALDGGNDGLDFYECIKDIWMPENKKCYCAFECGEGQAKIISDMFSRFGKTEIKKDIYEADRFIFLLN